MVSVKKRVQARRARLHIRRTDELRFAVIENRLTTLEKHHTAVQHSLMVLAQERVRDLANIRAEFAERIENIRGWMGERFDTLERITRYGTKVDEGVKTVVETLDERVKTAVETLVTKLEEK